ncbi:MAG: hypothetical protein ABL889_17340 [Terricaulis sp.]
MEDYYPLYAHDFSSAERKLLLEILALAKRRKRFVQSALGARAGLNLHHVIPKSPPKKGAAPAIGARERTSHASWVYLYNYVMQTLRGVCLAHGNEDGDLIKMIDRLHDLGLKSGRYETDMHLFNREALAIDLRGHSVDESFLDGAYALFRRRSDENTILVSALELWKHKDRTVFKHRTVSHGEQRLTSGLAYELHHHLQLFGFMNEGKEGEFITLHGPEGRKDYLCGVMQTASTRGIYHSKQCCAVRISQLFGTEDVAKTVVNFSAQLATFGAAVEQFLGKNGRLYTREGIIDLEVALDRAMVFVQSAHMLQPKPPEGPAG